MIKRRRNTIEYKSRRNEFLWFLCYLAVVVLFLWMVK